MKARKVVVTMEVETEATMAELKRPFNWDFNSLVFEIKQIQVNVVKEAKKKK